MGSSSNGQKPVHPLAARLVQEIPSEKAPSTCHMWWPIVIPRKYFYSKVKTVSSAPDTPGEKDRFRARPVPGAFERCHTHWRALKKAKMGNTISLTIKVLFRTIKPHKNKTFS
jgi:hypothetical protein